MKISEKVVGENAFFFSKFLILKVFPRVRMKYGVRMCIKEKISRAML
jgi:hypothetical protein